MKKPKILVVDDDAELRQLLSILLADDYDVVQAEDGQAALDLVLRTEEQFALLITDLRMPRLNGAELLRKLNQGIPAIVVSGTFGVGGDVTAEELIKLGVVACIRKPYEFETILATTRAALAKYIPQPQH